MKAGMNPVKLSKPGRSRGLELVYKGKNEAVEERKMTEISSGKKNSLIN